MSAVRRPRSPVFDLCFPVSRCRIYRSGVLAIHRHWRNHECFHQPAGLRTSANAVAGVPGRRNGAERPRGAEIGGPGDAGPSGAVSAGTFADALRSSLNDISDSQTKAANEGKAFELGSPNVSLNDVMVDAQKANIGFQFGL